MDKTAKAKIKRMVFSGEVASVDGNKTIRVSVKNIVMHPKYKKQYKIARKFAVHDEKNEAKAGDKVHFIECRPLSKTKRWRICKI